jgi:hypothetical protein
MKNTLILLSLLFLFSCKKKDSPTPEQTLVSQGNSIGLQFEHKYHIADSPLLIGNDSVVFHSNGTISESEMFSDTAYAVSYIFTSGNSSAIFEGGNAIRLYIPGALPNVKSFGLLFQSALYTQEHKDTMTLATFVSGDAVTNNKPTLAIQAGYNSGITYLWLN